MDDGYFLPTSTISYITYDHNSIQRNHKGVAEAFSRSANFYLIGFDGFVMSMVNLVVLVLFPLTQGWWIGYLGLSEYLDGRVEMMLTDGRSILGLNSGSGRVVRYQVLCVEGVSYNRENTDTASRLV